MKKVYIASSWKNEQRLKNIKSTLMDAGHEVDLFCESSPEGPRFVFSFDKLPTSHVLDDAITIFDHEEVIRAFQEDKSWLDWSDVVLLVLPSGRSAHLEAGYGVGSGKKLIIYQERFPAGEFDVMYGFADLITDSLEDVLQFLEN